MSERAFTILLTLADVRCGDALLICEGDASAHAYKVVYTDASCPAPGANPDSLRLIHLQRMKQHDSELEALKDVADADHSGFISTEEAMSLQTLIEFGCKFPTVVQCERSDTALVRYAMHMNRVELRQTIEDYRDLSSRLASKGLSPLPVIPW